MAVKRHERTRARRAALSLLYTSEITDEGATKIAEEGRFLAEEGSLPEYAQALVRGVEAHRAGIDKHLVATSENWALARMPIVDRSILRLAVYEMIYVDDVPTSVAINEAVELAKDYGGEDESPRFVNGVLGRIAKLLEEEASAGKDPRAIPGESVLASASAAGEPVQEGDLPAAAPLSGATGVSAETDKPEGLAVASDEASGTASDAVASPLEEAVHGA
ncbi:MAG: transcription antitermination factor NusB [Gordonibacter sp.]